MADKPRTRVTAENRQSNLARYQLGSFGPDAEKTLGIKVKYPNEPQGVTVSQFLVDSQALDAGIEQFDFILEVDNAPVGLIRDRHYEPWKRFGRSGTTKVELLVSYVDGNTGARRYYYPHVQTSPIQQSLSVRDLPPDFFTAAKKRTRQEAEDRTHNFARYELHAANFGSFSPLELGVGVNYSEAGALIQGLKPGGAAQNAELQVGDLIMEVDGAPIGKFGDRFYEAWRQYIHSATGKVELLVVFKQNGVLRHYYPEVQLDELSSPT